MKRIKSRELGLMLLPVLSLCAFAWFFRLNSGPFRVTIVGTKVVPLNLKSYRSKIVIDTYTAGRMPQGATEPAYRDWQPELYWIAYSQLVIRNGSRKRVIPLPNETYRESSHTVRRREQTLEIYVPKIPIPPGAILTIDGYIKAQVRSPVNFAGCVTEGTMAQAQSSFSVAIGSS